MFCVLKRIISMVPKTWLNRWMENGYILRSKSSLIWMMKGNLFHHRYVASTHWKIKTKQKRTPSFDKSLLSKC